MKERRPLFAGNWKMHKTRGAAVEFVRAFVDLLGDPPDRDVALFPPFTAIEAVRNALEASAKAAGGPRIAVGAQNCHFERQGAYTGETSAEMLADLGCRYVLVGHSERRHLFGETDEIVRRKLEAVLAAGLDPVLCVGETIEERRSGRTDDVIQQQVVSGLQGLSEEHQHRLAIAYEPVWAIGTGHVATPEQAEEVHAFIRGLLDRIAAPGVAATLRIPYGGSVKPDNIGGLMREPDIDGALVGGASLDAASFAALVRYDRGLDA